MVNIRMDRKGIKSYLLTVRISENKTDFKNLEFVEKKLRQGMSKSAILREAIRIYREFEEGELFVEAIKEHFPKILKELNLKEPEEPERVSENESEEIELAIKKHISGDLF